MGEFLPIIVAIVFGIYSLLKRNMSAKDNEKRKPFSPPNLDPMHPKHFENEKQAEVPREIKVETLKTEHLYRRDPVVKKNYVKEKSFKQEPIKLAKRKKSSTSIPKFNKHSLVEGVIMAEVLGSPRSKNPHYSNKVKKLPK
jgi:hypothetical protein